MDHYRVPLPCVDPAVEPSALLRVCNDALKAFRRLLQMVKNADGINDIEAAARKSRKISLLKLVVTEARGFHVFPRADNGRSEVHPNEMGRLPCSHVN